MKASLTQDRIVLERPEDFLSAQQRMDAITDVLATMIWGAMQNTEIIREAHDQENQP